MGVKKFVKFLNKNVMQTLVLMMVLEHHSIFRIFYYISLKKRCRLLPALVQACSKSMELLHLVTAGCASYT